MIERVLRNRSINQINLLGIIFLAFFVMVFASILIHAEYENLQDEQEVTRLHFIQKHKTSILTVVSGISSHIQYINKKQIQDQKDYIQNLITNIYSIQNSPYHILVLNQNEPLVSTFTKQTVLNLNLPLDKLMQMRFENEEYLLYKNSILSTTFSIVVGLNMHNFVLEQKEKEKKTKKRLIRVILEMLTLLILLFALIVASSKIISETVEKEINKFIGFYNNASTNYTYIDSSKMHFKEFKLMTFFANKMVQSIQKRDTALRELNATLEQKVADKTKELQLQNIDLAKEKKLNEQLLKSQDKFIKYAIHETNTPLSIILTNIDLYRMKNENNKYLTKIEAATKVIHNIYNDLSFLLKKDVIPFKRAKIDISTFLQERVEFFTEVAHGNKLDFQTQIESKLFVLTNDTKLQRIIDNNISNACKYAYPKTIIEINLYESNKKVYFCIKTQSDKINDTKKIFDANYRENIARGGFGLGLNLVKEICNDENIEIIITSDNSFTQFSYIFLKV